MTISVDDGIEHTHFSLIGIMDMWTAQNMGDLSLREGKGIPKGPRPVQVGNTP